MRFLAEDRRAGFDLSAPPMMRVSLLVLGQSRAVCVWTIHHTITDGSCYAPVLQRVLDGYAAPDGSPPAPGGAQPQFTDFLRWLERHDPPPERGTSRTSCGDSTSRRRLPLQGGTARTAENRCPRSASGSTP